MPQCACNQCGKQIEFRTELAGLETECPICGQLTTLTVPSSPIIRIPKQPITGPGSRKTVDNAVSNLSTKLIQNIEKVIVGKRDKILLTLAALLAEGHVLLEDVPGVAKTMLARALAQSMGVVFKRVQCTPDLLPNDITGASVFNPRTTEFEFRQGPLFASVLLADEINRATPRTQSALLEAMSERQVTVDGKIYALERPFFLIATQNPIDHEGTFPLPEAQLDRFLIRLSLGYPSLSEEATMLDRLHHEHPIDSLTAVVDVTEVLQAVDAVRSIRVDPKVRDYILKITHATRGHEGILLGASPRASMAIFRMAQGLAALQGFDYVTPDDVKQVAPLILGHRLILRPENRLRKITTATVIQEILHRVEVPMISAA
ncbi:MAG: MoxR-like ATPase [Verrucomicrobiales bacterium]|jgi:MoxR-like ATPase|nr:MoxR-like ATPase [Verrucomicrobiales bacterium]